MDSNIEHLLSSCRILSGSALKLIAVITMTVDHVTSHILVNCDAFIAPLLTYHNHALTWYVILRCIGRLAFPIFAFLIVEGFIHTRDRHSYGMNLLTCALVSEFPWALLHNGFHLMGHNVIFTLLLGYLGLCVIDHYRNDWYKVGLILIGMLAFAFLFRADYNGSGFAFIIMLYALRNHLVLQVFAGCTMLPMKWVAGLAFVPISMYNGQRGFIRGNVGKFLFYAFYPAHLLIIWIVQRYLL